MKLRKRRNELKKEEIKVVRAVEAEQEILLSSGKPKLSTMEVGISHLKYTGAYKYSIDHNFKPLTPIYIPLVRLCR